MTKLRLTEINNATEPLNTLSTYVLMTVITNPSAIDNLLNDFARTTDEIFSLEELRKLLLSGKQLRMKYGVDVTAPNLHIGHAVNLWMYRRLQELGHKVIFLIGDFTTQIGDPTGKNKLALHYLRKRFSTTPKPSLTKLLWCYTKILISWRYEGTPSGSAA